MKNYIKKNLLNFILLAFLLVLPVISLANGSTDPNPPTDSVKIENPLTKAKTISDLINTLLGGAIKIGLPVITVAIIYCGFLFVSAQGNSEKLGKAKDALLYTLIGAAILLGSWAIAQLITNTVTAL